MKLPVKRSIIVLSTEHDDATFGADAFAPPGFHLDRHFVVRFPGSMNNPGQGFVSSLYLALFNLVGKGSRSPATRALCRLLI